MSIMEWVIAGFVVVLLAFLAWGCHLERRKKQERTARELAELAERERKP